MTIYIDVFFIINFIADFFLLILCDFSTKKILKKCLAATIGSLYACLFVFNIPQIFFSPVTKILTLEIMCYIAFSPCSIKAFFEKCIFFLVTSIFFCGIFYASPLLLNFADIPWILLIFAAFFAIISAYTRIKDKLYSTNCKIKINYNKKSVTISAMIDTGNALKDPVSDMPVLVIDEKVLKSLFSPLVTRNNLCEFVQPEDFRIIPYKTISNSGITYGFIPHRLLIEDKIIKDTIIAVSPLPINTDALINPQLI